MSYASVLSSQKPIPSVILCYSHIQPCSCSCPCPFRPSLRSLLRSPYHLHHTTQAKVLEPGPDPTAPPPPPPPTPATHSEARAVGHGRLRHSERHRARDPDEIKESGRGAGFSTSSAITEGFAIEESEGEEPYSYNYEHHQHSMASGEEGHRYGGDESMSRTVTSTTHQSRRGLSGAFLRSFAEAESKELEEEKLEKHEEG